MLQTEAIQECGIWCKYEILSTSASLSWRKMGWACLVWMFLTAAVPQVAPHISVVLLLKCSFRSTFRILPYTHLKWASCSSKWAGTVTYMIKQEKDKAIWISQLLSGFTGLSLKEILPKWMRTMCNIRFHWRHETVDSNTSSGELYLHVWDLKSFIILSVSVNTSDLWIPPATF